jgi:hypothetical protein
VTKRVDSTILAVQHMIDCVLLLLSVRHVVLPLRALYIFVILNEDIVKQDHDAIASLFAVKSRPGCNGFTCTCRERLCN